MDRFEYTKILGMKYFFHIILLLWMTSTGLSVKEEDVKWPLYGCNKVSDIDKCVNHLYCVGYSIGDIKDKTRGNENGCPQRHDPYNGGYYYKIINLHFKAITNEEESLIPLDENHFSEYRSKIRYLDISNNKIVNYPTFQFMPNLVTLNISRNFLTKAKLSNPTNNEMNSLHEIDFSYNVINTISFSEDENLYLGLEKLNLSHNEITYLPDGKLERFNQITSLDLSYNNVYLLNALTFDGLKAMAYLYLAHNKITSINSSLLRLDKLLEIDLSYNRIEEIKNDDFRKLSFLKNLNLSHNRLKMIDSIVLSNLLSLIKINFNTNQIETIDQTAFVSTTQLEVIDLSQNELKTLLRGMFINNKAIESLTVTGNRLEGAVLKGTFEGLEMVLKLNFSYHYLTSLDDFAFLGLNNLQSLLLNNNKIQSLSKNAFKSLHKLIFLDLSNNQISCLDFVKEDLVSLQSLNLQNNNLSHIDSKDFLGLNRLITLDLSKNNIHNIESNCFIHLTELINFKLSKNPISGILKYKSFFGLSALPNLDISISMLTKINNGSFEGLKMMRELNISHSELNEIEFNSFTETGTLELLDVSCNKLSTFDVNTTDISKLKTLIINNNLIKIIASDTLKGLFQLSKLILSHNTIESIHNDALRDLKGLWHLDISHNPELNFDIKLLRNAQTLEKLVLSDIKVPVSFAAVSNISLTDLEMSEAGISDLTFLGIKKIKQLETLVLSKNELVKLEVGAFASLEKLRILDLSYNKITYIQPGVFEDNTFLYMLNISHNAISNFGYGVFSGLNYLHTIDISYNNIDNLDSERFYEMSGLTVLIADYNNIDYFRASEFAETSLTTLSIGGNPIPCDLLIKLDKSNMVTFSITAITLDKTKENLHGITCRLKNDQNKYNSGNYSTNEKILYNIRDILLNMSSAKQTEKHGFSDNNSKYINDMVSGIEKFNTGQIRLLNLITFLVTGNNKTNDLLNKLTNSVTSINNIRRSEPIPIPKENSTVNLIPLINKLKQDLEDTIAIEKQNVLNEVDKKISSLNVNVDASLAKSAEHSHEALSDTSKSDNSLLFIEVCVGIMFVTMIAFALYKLYLSGLVPRRRTTSSTRNLQEAMDNSVL